MSAPTFAVALPYLHQSSKTASAKFAAAKFDYLSGMTI
jgi:hypothetical protein